MNLGDLMAGSSLALSEIHFPSKGGVILYLMAYPVAPTEEEMVLVPGTPILDPPQTIDIKYIWRWLSSGLQ